MVSLNKNTTTLCFDLNYYYLNKNHYNTFTPHATIKRTLKYLIKLEIIQLVDSKLTLHGKMTVKNSILLKKN